MRRDALIAGLLPLLLASALAAPAGAAGRAPYGSAAVNRAIARRDAPRLLRALHLPAGSHRTAHEPAGTHRALSSPGFEEPTPNLTDAHGWWTSGRAPSAVIASVARRLPPDARFGGTVRGPGARQQTRYWTLPAVPGLGQRILVLAVVPVSPMTTAVRLDGEAVWLTPRPGWERIPGGASALSVIGQGEGPGGRVGRRSRPTLLEAASARRLIAFLNRLPVRQPGVLGCPVQFDETTTIVIDGPSHRPITRAVESPTGCTSVTLTIGTRVGPVLADGVRAAGSIGDELLRLRAFPTCAAGELGVAPAALNAAPIASGGLAPRPCPGSTVGVTGLFGPLSLSQVQLPSST